MTELLKNLNKLNLQHEQQVQQKRLELFDNILEKCYQKIEKYGTELKKQECLYVPPALILGKPAYDYMELINYIIDSLTKNGFKVKWLSDQKALYISWKLNDVKISPYELNINTNNCIEQTINCMVPTNSNEKQMSIMKISEHRSQKPQISKSKKNQNKATTQHIALLEYNGVGQDLIPINIKNIDKSF